MNPWEVILNTLGWFLLVIILVVALVVVWSLIMVFIGWVYKALPNTRAKRAAQAAADATTMEKYTLEATIIARDIYKDEVIFNLEQVNAFRAGASWGWGFHHRK